MRRITLLMLLLASTLIACGAGYSPPIPTTMPTTERSPTLPASDEKSGKVEALFDAFVTNDAPGGAVIVIRQGQILYKAGYGLADLEQNISITPQHLFHLASVGKQFTALAIIMLAEEGKLAYDDPIGKYLPELARFGDDLTIRRLLHHTSGIPDYYDDTDLFNQLSNKAEMPANAEALALLAETGELQFSPGEKFSYSNTGYEMLGSLIERISGQPYPKFVRERIFEPVGMAHTFSLPDPARLNDPKLAHSYTQKAGRVEAYDSDPFDNLIGSGSIYSTVEDLYLYDQALYTDKLVKQSSLAEAFKPALLNDGTESLYGFGWELAPTAGYVSHAGQWLAFTSCYVRFQEPQLSVIVLLNRDYDTPEPCDIALKIGDIYRP